MTPDPSDVPVIVPRVPEKLDRHGIMNRTYALMAEAGIFDYSDFGPDDREAVQDAIYGAISETVLAFGEASVPPAPAPATLIESLLTYAEGRSETPRLTRADCARIAYLLSEPAALPPVGEKEQP